MPCPRPCGWLIALVAATVIRPVHAEPEAPPDSYRIGGYSVVLVRDEETGGERVEVRAHGETLYKTGLESRAAIGAPPDIERPRITPGSDVDGNGVPDIVVYGSSGEDGCCATMWIVELGKRITEIAKVQGGRHAPELANLDDDSALEVIAIDDAFADWPGRTADSPSPRVVLDWGEHGLAPSCDLTFSPAAPESLPSKIERLRNEPAWKEPSTDAYAPLMSEVVDLFYRGHERDAIELFHAVRPAGDEAGTRLLIELGGRLEKSRYWSALKDCAPR